MLKHIFLITLVTILHGSLAAQSFSPSDEESKVSFVIKNVGISVDGTLKNIKGKMIFNPKKPSSSAFDVSVDANTINTNNKRRDDHLKKDDFFDVEKYPTIQIKTTSVQARDRQTYTAKAILTMHGVSKNIQFDFTAAPVASGYRFKGDFTINRKDYGVGGNSMTMGDDVKVNLDVVGKK